MNALCYDACMEIADIQHLAGLSRIAITDAEAGALATEFDAILGYVAQITEISADVSAMPAHGPHINVFREDAETNEPGAYTDALLSAAPERAGAYIQVKKILSGKG